MKLQKIRKIIFPAIMFFSGVILVTARDVTITVNTDQDKKAVSPYIYGRNESFDKQVKSKFVIV